MKAKYFQQYCLRHHCPSRMSLQDMVVNVCCCGGEGKVEIVLFVQKEADEDIYCRSLPHIKVNCAENLWQALKSIEALTTNFPGFYSVVMLLKKICTYGGQSKKRNAHQCTHGSNEFAFPGFGYCITISNSTQSNLKVKSVQYYNEAALVVRSVQWSPRPDYTSMQYKSGCQRIPIFEHVLHRRKIV